MIKFNERNINLARRAAAEGMILLKNENGTLPLSSSSPAALFGRNQLDTFKGGGGAANVWAVPVVSFADGIEKYGNAYAPLLKFYRSWAKANTDYTRHKIYKQNSPASLPEFPIAEDQVKEASEKCDTAIYFIGRFSSEHFDIKDIDGEYRITEDEEKILCLITKYFSKTVLVLNTASLFDLSFLDKYNIDAIVHTYLPGMEAGNALYDILYGKVNPCGRLPDSWAKTISEYPSATEDFGTKRVIYSEGIYMGYRYFDTFEKDVVFPFGYGLSYTDFSFDFLETSMEKSTVTLKIKVSNKGKVEGREVIQCYLQLPDGKLENPKQVLCGFEKTGLLAPNQSETVNVQIDLLDFTSYDEESASYILEKGDYILCAGKHSRETEKICAIRINDTVICRKVKNRVMPEEPFDTLTKNKKTIPEYDNLPVFIADFSFHKTDVIPDPAAETELAPSDFCKFEDVLSGKCTPEELVSGLTDEELVHIITGDGEIKRKLLGIVPDKEVAKGEGSHSHPVSRLGIPSTTMQDGPAGVRASGMSWPIPPTETLNGNDCICYPCSTLLAATWDRALLREIGRAVTDDLDRYNYTGWCAPGVNLHRNPLCGRNFEYFSEDPFLTAELAREEIIGVQEKEDGTPSGHFAILKHFACNNAEDFRLESDSILTERTVRELYLRVFEYIIRKYQPFSIMTSYNKVNGAYAAAREDLITGICRTEWGYKGWIMTDWDVCDAPEKFISAGVDIEMPGRVISPEAFSNGKLSRASAQRAAVNLIKLLSKTICHYN